MSLAKRTLREIRKGAPETDRNGGPGHVPDPALAPLPLPHWATARNGSKYLHVSLYPRTLNELRKYSREFGRAVARDAEWSCVIVWLMNQPPEADLSNAYAVVQTAVLMVREYDRHRFEYPRPDGSEPQPPALNRLSPEVREEALRVAAETLSDWRNAGRPHLEPRQIKAAYQNLIATPAFIEKYIRNNNDPHP